MQVATLAAVTLGLVTLSLAYLYYRNDRRGAAATVERASPSPWVILGRQAMMRGRRRG